MERVASEASADSSDEAITHPVAEGLMKGLKALAGADADHRPQAAQALNEQFKQVKQGDGAAVAKAVLRALEDPSLRGAEGVTGPSCRSEAVGALLRLGYPYALQVRPEDLLYHRQQSGSSRGRALTQVTVLVVLLLGLGAAAYLWMMPAATTLPPPAVDQPLSPSGPLPWHNTAPLPPPPAPPEATPQPREEPQLAPPEGPRPPEATLPRPPGHPPRPARRPAAGHVPPSAPLREVP